MKMTYQSIYEEQGYQVIVERPFVNYIPDLLCTNDHEIVAIECETCLSRQKIIKIINNAFGHVDRVIIVVPRKTLSENKKLLLMSEPRISVVNYDDNRDLDTRPEHIYHIHGRIKNFRMNDDMFKAFGQKCGQHNQSVIINELIRKFVDGEVSMTLGGFRIS